jgi:polyhydroxyalkanoic acid synthase PhaR subunit
VPQNSSSEPGSDPTAAWRQWYDSAATAWSQLPDGTSASYTDPFGIFRQWSNGTEERSSEAARTRPGPNPLALWQGWLGAMTAMGRPSPDAAATDPWGVLAQWQKELEQMRSPSGPPRDPLSLFREWFEKTSQTWSTMANDVIGREAFVEAASRFVDSYARSYKALRQDFEMQLHNLQMPTRSDVARVASLVAALEDKIDQLTDAAEATADRQTQAPTAAALGALEQRISRIETRLDALLSAVETLNTTQRARPTQGEDGGRPPRRVPTNGTRRTGAVGEKGHAR